MHASCACISIMRTYLDNLRNERSHLHVGQGAQALDGKCANGHINKPKTESTYITACMHMKYMHICTYFII